MTLVSTPATPAEAKMVLDGQATSAASRAAKDIFETSRAALAASLSTSSLEKVRIVEDSLQALLPLLNAETLNASADVLMQSAFCLFESGSAQRGIEWSLRITVIAERLANLPVQRRFYSFIGAQYGDIADFPSAMKFLELALGLARRLNDSASEVACLGNIVAVLQEMGHYRQAISIAKRVVELQADGPAMSDLKLQSASNGLFAAHRIGDVKLAEEFLTWGEKYLGSPNTALRRAFFEQSRTLFLIDNGLPARAVAGLRETAAVIGAERSPRVSTLLCISEALCKWANGAESEARDMLQELYRTTLKTRLYHHLVLQALVKIYGDADAPRDIEKGLAFAKELVEFTTSVKKAKFYKQLQSKAATSPTSFKASAPSGVTTEVDPFGASKEWLISTDAERLGDDPSTESKKVLATHEELTAIHEDMARIRVAGLRREIRTDAVDTAENWAIAAEFFDDETGQHCFRVGHLASMLAREIGMRDTFCFQIEHAARLHDIGKIAVNEVILLKPGPLNAAEMAAMQLHTEVGSQILSGSDDPTLRMAAEVARHHHEWWNGSGYPRRLSGRDIPLAARISTYADVYDALTHARAYKSAWSHERAVDEISRLAGTQFDPHLLTPFRNILDVYQADLERGVVPGLADMDSNKLIASRRKLMETIGG